jgi:hypothetical protein
VTIFIDETADFNFAIAVNILRRQITLSALRVTSVNRLAARSFGANGCGIIRVNATIND